MIADRCANMGMTIDISDWENEDWDETIPVMQEWICENEGNLSRVWPDTRIGVLHFSDINNAIEFMLKWG